MRWTEEELRYLREHYPDGNTAEIAKQLGRTEGAVHQMAAKQGLRKSSEFIAATLCTLGRQVSHTPKAIANRFVKGQEPFNKGKMRIRWGLEPRTKLVKKILRKMIEKTVEPSA